MFTNPISKLAFPDEAQARTIGGIARAPIVVVLLDELPPTRCGLPRADRCERYPGFGEPARNATWFKNAYTVYDSTERAQPAIMDGNLPTEDKQPISGDHPNSIFSLFGKTHRMNVSEEATSVCSRHICGEVRAEEATPTASARSARTWGWCGCTWSAAHMEADLPSVPENWGNFGVGGWRAGDDPGERNARSNLNAGASCASRNRSMTSATGAAAAGLQAHAVAHVPWQSARRAPLPAHGQRRGAGAVQRGLPLAVPARRAAQRHFLWTGFADRELQELGAISRSRGSTTSR